MDSNYRFLPTEEELVSYLREKKQVDHIIPGINICNHEPWEVPALYEGLFTEPDSPYQGMFFFSPRDYKYSDNNYARTNSATARGFWKTTGKERVIKAGGSIVRKRTFFYEGRVPPYNKNNWVMHEYCLIEDEANPTPKLAQQVQRDFVLCCLKKKQDKKDTSIFAQPDEWPLISEVR
ncbi:PREDICTED: protein NTM1-like 9 [Prunus mume]|uniref:Protein NTM1-like 9 n=1 Tax=Prunus mume TaxID=102107 RepID=A0ABM0P2F6_PRUMU|nr:PREDICTED: protein NTM1-like 9 [Prunus mume]